MIQQQIERALPGATTRRSDYGLEVGSFSMPSTEAREILRAAGLAVRDVWGATVVTGLEQVQTQVAVRDGATVVAEQQARDQGPDPSHKAMRLFEPAPEQMPGQTNLRF